MTAQGEDILVADFLYGIEAGHEVLNEWVPTRIVRFRVTKKTPRRVYYVLDSGTERTKGTQRYVDRVVLERDGQVTRQSAGWWEPDLTVYLHPPVLEEARKPSLADLKSEMRAAHPDMGGSHEAFLAARERYERARIASRKTPPSDGDQMT